MLARGSSEDRLSTEGAQARKNFALDPFPLRGGDLLAKGSSEDRLNTEGVQARKGFALDPFPRLWRGAGFFLFGADAKTAEGQTTTFGSLAGSTVMPSVVSASKNILRILQRMFL